MLDKIKFIFSSIGQMLWPFIQMFMKAEAPVILNAAISAVKVVNDNGMFNSSNDPMGNNRREMAFKQIQNDLIAQGIQAATGVILDNIQVAVRNLEANQK